MTEREYMIELLRHVAELHRKVDVLLRGHNGLVEILRHQGRRMATILDVLAADEAKLVKLQTGIEALLAALAAGGNTLTPEAQQAADALSAHFDAVQSEVDTALPSQGGGPVSPSASGPDAGTVGV